MRHKPFWDIGSMFELDVSNFPASQGIADWDYCVWFSVYFSSYFKSQAHSSWAQHKNHVKNLGFIMDSDLKSNWMDKQVNSNVRSSFFQLRQISKPFLNLKDTQKVILAFISSHLDYCSLLYFGFIQSVFARLQLVQNSAARLLMHTHKREHITPILASLYCLPKSYRIDFKLAPSYLSDLIFVQQPPRSLKSGNQIQLKVPRIILKHRGYAANPLEIVYHYTSDQHPLCLFISQT